MYTQAIQRLHDVGGFTLHVRTGEQVEFGFPVGIAPESTVVRPLADVDEAALLDFVEANRPVWLGGWVDDDGLAHLDVVQVFRNVRLAAKAGDTFGETAIYDLATDTTIFLADARVKEAV